MRITIFILVLFMGWIQSESFAQDFTSSGLMNLSSLNSESGSAPVGSQNSLKRKMVLFDFKEDLECPVFSNSPYTEALDSIEKMQTQINKVFPPCDSKDKTAELTEATQKFRDRIAQAQRLQKTGLTTQFNSMVKDALSSGGKLQALLSEAAKAPVSVCAQSNRAERKSMIFQINDTFQSLSPVILDLVSQVPGLSTAFAPYIKVFVGAEGISKNISMIESLIIESEMFDMTVSENRKNTIKNVCQFMKLYRRLKFLRHSRWEEVQKITGEYERKITLMKRKVEIIKNENAGLSTNSSTPKSAGAPTPLGAPSRMGESMGGRSLRPMNAGFAVQVSTDLSYDAFINLTDDTRGVMASKNHIKSTIQFVDEVKTTLANPEISQCQNIMKEVNRKEHKVNLAALVTLSQYYKESQVERYVNSADAYLENMKLLDLKNRSDLKECVALGMDWLISNLQAFEMSDGLMRRYEDELIALNGVKYYKNHREIKKTNRKIENEKSELAQIKTMIDVASFESSEVEKNAKGLYRFFLNGPRWNEISSKSPYKKFSVWMVNEGPVFSLLKNTESNFLDALEQIQRALHKIQIYEMNWSLKPYKGKIPSTAQEAVEWQRLEQKYITELPHLTPENFPQYTARHQTVCNSAALAVDYYIQAATHLMSSESLCAMVAPALIEEEVSPSLRAYCQVTTGSAWRNSSRDRLADIEQLKEKIVGGRAPIITVIDNLLKKVENLKCE